MSGRIAELQREKLPAGDIEPRWFSFCGMRGISSLDVILCEMGVWNRRNGRTKDRFAIEEMSPPPVSSHSSIHSAVMHSGSSALGIAPNEIICRVHPLHLEGE